MPSIDHLAERHSILDSRPGLYLSFPDIVLAGDDPACSPLVAVYRESDGHYPTFQKLLVRTSRDQGETWSAARTLNAQGAHCPRISRLWPGTAREQLAVIDDGFPKSVYLSPDQGRSWSQTRANGMRHVIPDRLLTLDETTLFTTAHFPRGDAPHPATGQPVCEQMCFISKDMGRSWTMRSVLANDPRLVFCEASIARLPTGRLLALLRENTGVFEPCYACVSSDHGATWTDPAPTPIIGHRPCVGVLRDGRVLVTYRDVSPAPGTAAWLGHADELLHGDFEVHAGIGPGCTAVSDSTGLHLTSKRGERPLYALRPLTDPATARATLEADVRVDMRVVMRADMRADADAPPDSGLGLRLGAWFTVGPDFLKPNIRGARRLRLEPGRVNRIRLDYDRGTVTVRVNGRKKRAYDIPPTRQARPVLVGIAPGACGPLYATIASLRLSISEPRHLRAHEWQWAPPMDAPGSRAQQRRLLLRSGNGAWGGDFGYSGWVELADGHVLCAYHHAEGSGTDYTPTKTTHVALTRFHIQDFQ